jgi:hypothetical protein
MDKNSDSVVKVAIAQPKTRSALGDRIQELRTTTQPITITHSNSVPSSPQRRVASTLPGRWLFPGSIPNNVARSASCTPGASSLSQRLIVSEHLVQDSPVFGSVSHSLMGGEVTRDIYKWQESNSQRQRRNSAPSIAQSDPPQLTASELMVPGMFRRSFIQARASSQGRTQPPPLTRNFIDFLVLYVFDL